VKKQVFGDGQAVRILEVSPRWKELDWCSNAHVGYVTSGKLMLEFAGQRSMEVGRGQGFWIPRGCAHKASCKRTTTLLIVD
jgi:quercetin dioxygenase-like cupin family protein